MASFQIGPVSSTVGLARATIARRATCRGCHQLSSSFSRYSSTASRRAQPTQRGPGRRPFSQQSHRPKADSKVNDSKIRWYPIPVGLGGAGAVLQGLHQRAGEGRGWRPGPPQEETPRPARWPMVGCPVLGVSIFWQFGADRPSGRCKSCQLCP